MKKRTYTRPYLGVMKEGVDFHAVNKELLAQGKAGLTMETKRRHVVPCKNQVFRSATTPTEEEFPYFSYVIGPFRTARAAYYMADHGMNNSHCQTVADAERLALLHQGQSELCADAMKHM